MTTWNERVREQLKRHEGTGRKAGNRFLPYTDTVGKITLGWGRNISDNGISKDEAETFLTNDIIDAEDDARRLLTDTIFEALSEDRKAVIVNMAFNLGYARLSRFTAMLGALKAGRYQDAAREMRNSAWATQVKGRAEELAGLMEKGVT